MREVEESSKTRESGGYQPITTARWHAYRLGTPSPSSSPSSLNIILLLK